MSILMSEVPAVKPYVTIERHQSGAWKPLYVNGRGRQVLPIYLRFNNRPSVEFAARTWAEAKGILFKEPEQPVMIRICAWCLKKGIRTVLGTVPCLPEQAGKETHGICDDCAREYFRTQLGMGDDEMSDDLKLSLVDTVLGVVKKYSHGANEIEEGVREYTDWMR